MPSIAVPDEKEKKKAEVEMKAEIEIKKFYHRFMLENPELLELDALVDYKEFRKHYHETEEVMKSSARAYVEHEMTEESDQSDQESAQADDEEEYGSQDPEYKESHDSKTYNKN